MELKVYFGCIFALIFIPTYSESQSLLNLIEGQKANLTFPYPCESTEVTLQHGYKAPFYRSTVNPESLMTPDQVNRYRVGNNSGNGKNCLLYLTISPLSRTDAGTYICQLYKDGQLLPEYPRVGLDVDYPPGKATCELTENYELEDWGALSCTAPVGSLPGQISCFQDSVVSPPVLQPTQTETVLRHVFWVRYTLPVFCCSTASDQPADQCECTDFVWIPNENGTSNTTFEPCTATTPGQRSSSSSSSSKNATTTNIKTVTSQANTKQTTLKSDFHWAYGLIIGLVFVILFLCVVVVYYYKASKKHVRLNQNEEVECEPLQ